MEHAWSTDRLPEGERFAHWQEIVTEAFVPVAVARREQGEFRSSVRARAVGPLRVSRIESGAQSVARTASLMRRDERESYFLNLPLTDGTSAAQHGRTARLDAGDFTIVDSARPFALGFARRFDQISIQLPRELLHDRIGESAVATRVDGSNGIGAIVSGALRTLALDTAAVDRHSARRLAAHLCGLIALALAEEPVGARPSARERLLQAALDELEAGLADPDLSPRTVADRISVSPRYLHRLFSERDTTFGRCLLERRLQRGWDGLADPALADRPIGQIACEVGFTDPSYFARAFKLRYGITPGQARRQAGRSRRADGPLRHAGATTSH